MEDSELRSRLKELPLKAIAAFAVRQAQRVEPLYSMWKAAKPVHILDLWINNKSVELWTTRGTSSSPVFAKGALQAYAYAHSQAEDSDSSRIGAAGAALVAHSVYLSCKKNLDSESNKPNIVEFAIRAASINEDPTGFASFAANTAHSILGSDSHLSEEMELEDLLELEENALSIAKSYKDITIPVSFFERPLWSKLPAWWDCPAPRRGTSVRVVVWRVHPGSRTEA